MRYLIMFIFLILPLSSCDRLKVEDQLDDKDIEIQELKTRNSQLILEVKDLSAQVARLMTQHPDGALIEEFRKGLLQKEAELSQREERIVREEERLNLMNKKLISLQQKFYHDTGEKLEEIGEARQIKKDYEHMQQAVIDANDRVNNWLFLIVILGACFLVGIMYLIVAGMKYSRHRTDMETAIKLVEEDRKLLSDNFDKKNR